MIKKHEHLCRWLSDVAVAVDKNFTLMADSWKEQRNYTYVAIEALDNHPVIADIKSELDRISPEWPNLLGELQCHCITDLIRMPTEVNQLSSGIVMLFVVQVYSSVQFTSHVHSCEN